MFARTPGSGNSDTFRFTMYSLFSSRPYGVKSLTCSGYRCASAGEYTTANLFTPYDARREQPKQTRLRRRSSMCFTQCKCTCQLKALHLLPGQLDRLLYMWRIHNLQATSRDNSKIEIVHRGDPTAGQHRMQWL